MCSKASLAAHKANSTRKLNKLKHRNAGLKAAYTKLLARISKLSKHVR